MERLQYRGTATYCNRCNSEVKPSTVLLLPLKSMGYIFVNDKWKTELCGKSLKLLTLS
jgi:hypothetical protein